MFVESWTLKFNNLIRDFQVITIIIVSNFVEIWSMQDVLSPSIWAELVVLPHQAANPGGQQQRDAQPDGGLRTAPTPMCCQDKWPMRVAINLQHRSQLPLTGGATCSAEGQGQWARAFCPASLAQEHRGSSAGCSGYSTAPTAKAAHTERISCWGQKARLGFSMGATPGKAPRRSPPLACPSLSVHFR